MFDASRPGKEAAEVVKTTPNRRSKDGFKGIVSCLAESHNGAYVAVGTFSGALAIYNFTQQPTPVFKRSEMGGLTQLAFSPDDSLLFCAARNSDHLECFDVRDFTQPLFRFERPGKTNQRLYFDLDPSGRYLATGDTVTIIILWI